MDNSNSASNLDWVKASHDLNVRVYLELEPESNPRIIVGDGQFTAGESRFLTTERGKPSTSHVGIWSDLTKEEERILSAAFPEEEK